MQRLYKNLFLFAILALRLAMKEMTTRELSHDIIKHAKVAKNVAPALGDLSTEQAARSVLTNAPASKWVAPGLQGCFSCGLGEEGDENDTAERRAAWIGRSGTSHEVNVRDEKGITSKVINPWEWVIGTVGLGEMNKMAGKVPWKWVIGTAILTAAVMRMVS